MVVVHRLFECGGVVGGGAVAEVVRFVVKDVVAPAVLVEVVDFAAQVAVVFVVFFEPQGEVAGGEEGVNAVDVGRVVVVEGEAEAVLAAVGAAFARREADAALRTLRGVDVRQPLFAGAEAGIVQRDLPFGGVAAEGLPPVSAVVTVGVFEDGVQVAARRRAAREGVADVGVVGGCLRRAVAGFGDGVVGEVDGGVVVGVAAEGGEAGALPAVVVFARPGFGFAVWRGSGCFCGGGRQDAFVLAEGDAFRQDLAVRAFCLALVEGFAGFGGAFMAFGDDEQVFGAGDADVVQAAVFFVFVAFVFCFGGAFGFARAEAEAVAVAHGVEADATVAVAAFVAAAGGEDDDGRLQAFGFVDGEELYGVCAGQRRHGGPVGLGRVGELALPPAAVMGGVLFGRAFGEQLLDVAQVEEVAVVVGVGGGGEGLPDAVFGVVKQRGEGSEQAAALPLGAGTVQSGAQVGKGVFVRLCFVFALFDGGEVVEVGLGFVVVGAGEEAVVVGAVFGVADGGEQVGKGAGNAAGKEVLFVLEFAVDAVPVQFLLQGDEAAVAAHEDLDVARTDAA